MDGEREGERRRSVTPLGEAGTRKTSLRVIRRRTFFFFTRWSARGALDALHRAAAAARPAPNTAAAHLAPASLRPPDERAADSAARVEELPGRTVPIEGKKRARIWTGPGGGAKICGSQTTIDRERGCRPEARNR